MANTAGGAFNPHADIDFTGTVTISGTLAVTGSGSSGGSTLVTESGNQTLTNKTLTSPVVTGPTITGGTSTAVPPATEYAEDGAIAVATHIAVLTKSTEGAYTLAAPTADNIQITITSESAAAHVVTATNLIENGTTGGPHDKCTFAAFPGASITLLSRNGVWNVLSATNVTVASN